MHAQKRRDVAFHPARPAHTARLQRALLNTKFRGKLHLIAPDKAARMAAIQTIHLPIPGVVSREAAKASSIKDPTSSSQYPSIQASRIQHQASSIQHPASSIQHPASSIKHPASKHPASNIKSPPVLPTSSKRSERVV
jgi:hypothetical protein